MYWASLRCISVALALCQLVSGEEDAFNPLDFVDPLIGSANGGNVFSGATLPYGLAKAVADTNSGSNQGGFTLDGSPVSGFSVLHDSGTGGSPSLGNFPLFAYAACPQDDIDQCVFPKKSRVNYGRFRDDSVKAIPGYFSITLDSGTMVEMTTTHRTALFRFTFSNTTGAAGGSYPLILQDLTDLSDSRQNNGTISVDATTGRMTGGAVFKPSFGSGTYSAYFCTDFSGSAVQDTGIFVNSRASTDVKDLTISLGINGYPLPGGAFTRFQSADVPVLARVGVSFISPDQACSNAESEIPDFDFESVSDAAYDAWLGKISPVTVSMGGGVNQSLVTNFYSGVYRTMVNPQNYTGENPLWESSEPYFDSFYCLWDSFRSQIPFLTILDPSAVAQMIRSLIDTYRHEGWLPDCHMSFCKGYTQGGSNADNVLADAYIKGITDGIDWATGYAAVVKDAEVEPFDWSNNGRGGVDSWKSLEYIPVQDFDYKGFGTMTRSISRTLEYSYNDFCISQIAQGMNLTSDAEKYQASSEYWKNLYNPSQASYLPTGGDTGFTGFFQPKYLNQTWGFQDPLWCSNIDNSGRACSLTITGQETFESSIWEYGFFVPHNQADLITFYGGPDEFVRRLDYLHNEQITYIGNEPAFLTVYQYHYAGRPALSALRSHFYIPLYFDPSPGGLPGNDDSGAMGSFVAFSMMGLFPNPGQDVYFITPPYFESVNITHPTTQKTATIRNVNFDPDYAAIYIQSATLNGEPYTKNWIDHSFFTEGKELVLILGTNETSWGQSLEDLPPSLGTYSGFD
ncbi:putative alpha-1,2-mannosidase family protein [Xylariales sp. PMI_506]|nr:putative alpha-1,2-mannosidase family protein [Xylariales sp. PMI_506]